MITGDTKFHITNEKLKEISDRQISESISTGRISPDDAALITEFLQELRAVSQISLGRFYKLQCLLVAWRDNIPEYRSLDTSAVFSAIETIKTIKGNTGGPKYSPSTQTDYIKTLKRFLSWMSENGYANSNLNLAKIAKVKSPGYKTTKTAEMMLTPHEIKDLIEAATNLRDKLLISLLYETGCRVGELGTMIWQQIKFSEQTATLNTDAKTGKGRLIPVVYSVTYLKDWKNNYPKGEPRPEDYLFVNLQSCEPLQYRSISKMLTIAAERGGIQKHFSPHTLRHSRITHLLRAGLSESAIKRMMWGSLSSNMLANYAHLTDEDLENEYCELLGIIRVEREEDKSLEPRQCHTPGCGCVCPASFTFCPRCGGALTKEAAEELSDLKKEIHASEDYKRLYEDLMSRMEHLEGKLNL